MPNPKRSRTVGDLIRAGEAPQGSLLAYALAENPGMAIAAQRRTLTGEQEDLLGLIILSATDAYGQKNRDHRITLRLGEKLATRLASLKADYPRIQVNRLIEVALVRVLRELE